MVKKGRGDVQILRAKSDGGKVVGHRDELVMALGKLSSRHTGLIN